MLRAVLKHDVDPNSLAAAAESWQAASGVDLMTFLIERGALSQDDAGPLELSATEGLQVAVSDSSVETPCPDPSEEITTPPPSRDGPISAAVDGAEPAADRYKIVRLYKQGGLGEIWLARDSVIGREVALKSLRTEQAGNEPAKFRFMREARITGQLEHPSIVPLYDFRESATEPFYVMRFVSGRTLAEAAVDYHKRRAAGEAGALDLNALLDAFIAVCRAVAFAHSRNILHRDLKGQNIVLGEFGEVFLLDWGLAKQVTAPEDPTLVPGSEVVAVDQMTVDGSVVGTLAFMAPEVVQGGTATKKSDVYGLGAVLYVILTGRAPYGGTSKEEVRSRVMSEAPAPVAVANPSAPNALVAICTMAMARGPTARYYSADELATDVRRWLADEPVIAFKERWPARLARWARRRRTTVVAAAVLLLTTAVATSIAALLVWNEQRRTEVARKQASDNADTALNVVRDLGGYVEQSEASGAPKRAPNDQQRKVRLDATLASYERLLAAYPEDLGVRSSVARINRYRANLSRLLNETKAAGEAYEQARRYYKELAEAKPNDREYRQLMAETTRDYGLFLQTLGRSRQASEMLDDALRVYDELQFAKSGDMDLHRTVANMQLDRSDIDFQLGRFGDSERAARRAIEIYAKMAETPGAHPQPIDAMFWGMADNRLALALRERKQTVDAIAAHDAAVNRLRGLSKVNATRDVIFQLHRARAERAWTLSGVADRRTEADAELKEAIAGFESLAKQHERLPLYPRWQGTAHLYRGRLFDLQGRRDAAITELTVAATIFEALVEKYKDIPAYRGELGQTYTTLGKLAANAKDAETWRDKARKMLDDAVRRHPESVQHKQALEELNKLSSPPKP